VITGGVEGFGTVKGEEPFEEATKRRSDEGELRKRRSDEGRDK